MSESSAAARDVAEAIARGALLTALVIVLACVAVRWILPLALRTLRRPLQDLVDILAACAVLPEYWLSVATRNNGRPPPLLAYDYGYAVGWIAHMTHNIIDWVFSAVARAARTLHPIVVGFAAGAFEISVLAGWI